MKIDSPELAELYRLFQKYKTLSAKAISEKTDTYPATAKRRVESLQKQGVKLRPTTVREGERGPESAAWTLEGDGRHSGDGLSPVRTEPNEEALRD